MVSMKVAIPYRYIFILQRREERMTVWGSCWAFSNPGNSITKAKRKNLTIPAMATHALLSAVLYFIHSFFAPPCVCNFAHIIIYEHNSGTSTSLLTSNSLPTRLAFGNEILTFPFHFTRLT